jgi:hypothetical protein
MAFKAGSVSAMRAAEASTSSNGETSPLRNKETAFAALNLQSSFALL